MIESLLPLGEILYEHAVPRGAMFVAGAAALGVAAFSFLRYLPRALITPVLAGIRLAFFAVLLWCLLMPLKKDTESETVKPRFVVALDRSASMTMTPTSSVPTRWSVAQNVLAQDWQRALASQCEIDLYAFADQMGDRTTLDKAGALTADGSSSRLRSTLAGLAERYQGQRLAGMLVLTDGLDTRENNADWAGGTWPCPIYTVRLEPEAVWEREADVGVDSVETPAKVIVGWDSKLTAVVSGQGTKGAPVQVQLLRNGQLLEEQPTQIPSEGGSREITFALKNPELGAFTYTVTVPPLPGEQMTNNNAFTVSAVVVDARNRVLYLEDTPRWESKYLTRVLRGNPAVTPLIFIRGPEGRFLTFGARGDTSMDFTDAQMAMFKMAVLGDLDGPTFTPARAEQMVKFVEGGGNLIVLGGPKSWGPQGWLKTPLAKVLPVKSVTATEPVEGKFSTSITPDGRAHPIFQAKEGQETLALPPVLSLYPGATISPGASTLVEAEGSAGRTPLVVAHRYGQGKVVVLLTDSLWRWQLDPGQANAYAKFWGQLLEWMTPKEEDVGPFQVDLFASVERVYLGDALTLNARVGGSQGKDPANAEVSCEVTDPAGRKLPFVMARRAIATGAGKPVMGYATDLSPEKPGLYQATAKATVEGKTIASQPYTFYVQPFTPETRPQAAATTVLQALARASNGRFLETNEVTEVLSALEMKGTETERVQYDSLWNRPWWLALLVGLLTVEWLLRRLRNMA